MSLDLQAYGIIDKTGEFVIPPVSKEVENFGNGYACYKKDGKYGIIDIKNKKISKPLFDMISNFGGDVCRVEIDGEKQAFDVKNFKFDEHNSDDSQDKKQ